jgi:HEAT repeat protein
MAGPEGNLVASQEVKKMVERFSSAKETEPDHVIGPEDLHNAALSALFTLDRTEAERVFSAELASSNDGVRRNAVLLMGDTQFKPSSIVSRVLRAMEDSNEKVRHAALRVIELRHLAGARVQAALKSASEDPDGDIGSYARHLYVERGGAEGQ